MARTLDALGSGLRYPLRFHPFALASLVGWLARCVASRCVSRCTWPLAAVRRVPAISAIPRENAQLSRASTAASRQKEQDGASRRQNGVTSRERISECGKRERERERRESYIPRAQQEGRNDVFHDSTDIFTSFVRPCNSRDL